MFFIADSQIEFLLLQVDTEDTAIKTKANANKKRIHTEISSNFMSEKASQLLRLEYPHQNEGTVSAATYTY